MAYKREYHFSAWVHPTNGGSDYPLRGTIDLTHARGHNSERDARHIVVSILREANSESLDDYRITKVTG